MREFQQTWCCCTQQISQAQCLSVLTSWMGKLTGKWGDLWSSHRGRSPCQRMSLTWKTQRSSVKDPPTWYMISMECSLEKKTDKRIESLWHWRTPCGQTQCLHPKDLSWESSYTLEDIPDLRWTPSCPLPRCVFLTEKSTTYLRSCSCWCWSCPWQLWWWMVSMETGWCSTSEWSSSSPASSPSVSESTSIWPRCGTAMSSMWMTRFLALSPETPTSLKNWEESSSSLQIRQVPWHRTTWFARELARSLHSFQKTAQTNWQNW